MYFKRGGKKKYLDNLLQNSLTHIHILVEFFFTISEIQVDHYS